MTRKTIQAWHWTSGTLRDGTKVETGKKIGPKEPILYESGYHASKRILDALGYAPGSIICRVKTGSKIVHGGDKLVSNYRTVLWMYDAESILRSFARRVALDAVVRTGIRFEDPVVLRWLVYGDESDRKAARSAVYWAAESAANSAAESAANSAANSAAYWAAEWAANSAAQSAANSAAEWAANSAAQSAARWAAREKYNTWLTEMILDGARERGLV